MVDEAGHEGAGVVEREGCSGADTLAFKGLVEAFEFAVALGVEGRGTDMGHTGEADKLLEVAGDELGAIIGDHTGMRLREFFLGALEDDFDIRLGHGGPDLPVHDVAAAAIQNAAEVVESPTNIEIRDIHMPVLVGLLGLDEAGAFFGGFGVGRANGPGLCEDTVSGGGAGSHDTAVDHHECQAAVALTGMDVLKVEDGLLLPIL